ncbi:MAG: hypothetical protein R3D02_15770 [Hyphomicrobiales bacterium]
MRDSVAASSVSEVPAAAGRRCHHRIATRSVDAEQIAEVISGPTTETWRAGGVTALAGGAESRSNAAALCAAAGDGDSSENGRDGGGDRWQTAVGVHR